MYQAPPGSPAGEPGKEGKTRYRVGTPIRRTRLALSRRLREPAAMLLRGPTRQWAGPRQAGVPAFRRACRTRVLGINGTENRVKVTRYPQCQSPCAGARGTGSPVWKALSLVFLSTRHFPVQLLAVYRTSILLIIQQITSKNPASPGTSFMFHYALRCCRPGSMRDCTGIHWNLLEHVGRPENS